jgi:hypothetical protein
VENVRSCDRYVVLSSWRDTTFPANCNWVLRVESGGSLSEGVRAAYLCDGLIYTRAGVFMRDLELQAMTEAMDGGQASFI